MEIWKGDTVEGQMKIYESDLWVDEFEKTFTLKFTDAELCNCKPGLAIEFRFVSRNQYRMENTTVVSCFTTLARMTEGLSGIPFAMQTPEGLKLGRMYVQKIELLKMQSFAELMKKGTQISLIGAIDFTYSNGGAGNPSSLHYIAKDKQNPYEIAL
jgi:hypothetical protein